ncbi:MAG TPA: sulfatase-like hydrolase/transferase, partial [Vicinamibacteria bacterium]|nr:sulfatase-like hydrolase/transferase [Vicinamibacteria bacterium]
MKRLVIVAAAASAASALIAFAPVRPREEPLRAAASSAPASRPNVVLLLAEGAGAGEHRVPTPNLDRLAQRGRRFDGAYTTYPLAGASRTSLMTGWRPEKTGVWGEPDGRVDGATPLQEHFRAGGYFTARVGPVFHGPGEGEYRWDAVNAPRAGVPLATRAAAAVTQAREPFFVAVSLGSAPPASAGRATTGEPGPELPAIAVAPLEPMARPGGVARPRRLADSERQALRAAQDARLTALDGQVGAVLDALDRRGAADRTVVVLVGDTSAPTGAHGALGRGDLLFEETLRVPLVIASPAMSSPGTPAAGLVELVDVYPTLLELCGLPAVAGVDGRSLGPLLADPGAAVREAAFSSVGRAAGQIGRSLRTTRWRYTEWPDGSEELYDHEADPREFTNLAGHADHAATVGDLRRLLAAREKYAPGAAAAPGPATRRRLNVLFVIADDLNVHLGAYGYPVATP